MKTKTKLTLGVGLLFLLIILLSLVSARYIHALKGDTEKILVANYNSLEYSRYMLSSLERLTPNTIATIEKNLIKQEANITEIGEGEATRQARDYFTQIKDNNVDSAALRAIRGSIYKVMDLNMQAIQRKSEIAKATADEAVFWIAITGTLCFLIAFTLLINLPSNIANPIKELSESIRQIADKNYSQRVHFESHNEFGELAASFNTMAQKLEEFNDSNLAILMMEKKRIETLINNMNDPVIGLDENLKVIFVNEEAIKIIGLSQQQLIGKATQDLAVMNDLIRTLIQDLMVADSSNGIKPKPIKIYADNKEGYFEKETLHISIKPTGEQKQRLIGHVILLRNITAYKELDFAKTNFIATISHEFKTPISSIQMSLQLLENNQIGQLNTEQTNLVDSIKDDANRLLKITGELLNMTQVESGNIQLGIIPSAPIGILNYAIKANKIQADEKKIKLIVEAPENLPTVLADSEKTGWVLVNLISNAIRYSYDNAAIILSIKEAGEKIVFSVKDSGQGIAPQYQHKIFDRYFRIPGTKKEGTGLGLSISKEFIEAQGGTIAVESDLGAGSTFTVTLNKATA